ncbi:hypothetical protein E8E15_002081 [Penicillium rubens]|nr:hypothetical protein E8E15_002081 [Penicillium rubens]
MNLIQLLLALTLLPATIAGYPTSHPPTEEHHDNKHNWTFDLFHNKHCAGTTVSYAGQGSTGCRTNLENGGAEAFINVNIDRNYQDWNHYQVQAYLAEENGPQF